MKLKENYENIDRPSLYEYVNADKNSTKKLNF